MRFCHGLRLLSGLPKRCGAAGLLQGNAPRRALASIQLRRNQETLNIKQADPRGALDRSFQKEVPENRQWTLQIKDHATAGSWDEAKMVFDSILQKNSIVYNAIIDAAATCRQYQQGLDYFNQMKASGYRVTPTTYSVVLKILGAQGRHADAKELWAEMDRQHIPYRDRLAGLTGLLNSAALTGNIDAVKEEMDCARRNGIKINRTHYGCLMKAYREAVDPQGAVEVLLEMQSQGVPATVVHFSLAMGTVVRKLRRDCQRERADEYVKTIMAAMTKAGVEPDAYFIEDLVSVTLGVRVDEVGRVALGSLSEESYQEAVRVMDDAAQRGIPRSKLLNKVHRAIQQRRRSSHAGAAGHQPHNSGRAVGAAAPPSALPAGWEQAPDPASGRTYYFNRATGQSSWTPPVAAGSHLRSAGLANASGLDARFKPWQQKCIDGYVALVDRMMPGYGGMLRRRVWGGKCQPITDASQQKFINAGQGTTATKSLDCLFQQMGFRQHHWTLADGPNSFWEELVHLDWGNLNIPVEKCIAALNTGDYGKPFEMFDLIGDLPVGTHFLDFFACRPNAKVLLTTRPAPGWAKARLRHLRDSEPPLESPCGLKMRDAPAAVGEALFSAHDDLVRCLVPKERLFVVDVFSQSTSGLSARIANFAGRPAHLYNVPYPHVSAHDDDACFHHLVGTGQHPQHATPRPAAA